MELIFIFFLIHIHTKDFEIVYFIAQKKMICFCTVENLVV